MMPSLELRPQGVHGPRDRRAGRRDQRALAGGGRGGPVLIKWLEQLLEDRARRIRIARVLVDSRLPPGQGAAPARPAGALSTLALADPLPGALKAAADRHDRE